MIDREKMTVYEHDHLSESECVMTNAILIWVVAPTIASKKM